MPKRMCPGDKYDVKQKLNNLTWHSKYAKIYIVSSQYPKVNSCGDRNPFCLQNNVELCQ